MTRKELYNICHDEAVAYANSEQWSKRTGREKSFLIQGYLDAMMEARKSEITEKKKEFPKTYKECCEILGIENSAYLTTDEEGYWNDYELGLNYLIEHFRKLLICRDAYWKIAGEEMGLGKSWKPDWKDGNQKKYCVYNDSGDIKKSGWFFTNAILAFPTEEMRDAFYENFKEEIEICKELL